MTAARTTTRQTTATGWVLRIGSTAGIAGALLAMVGNLIHPATPIGDPEGVAATIAGSRIWVPGHLAIVVGALLASPPRGTPSPGRPPGLRPRPPRRGPR